ncbi:L-piperidine-6-carboxylate dehydrogenase [Kaistella antarctica]|uniref:aldehyde dehydrogenase (NAD(+)) n=1 Tax=Kaistella antarctica TaxID=266748 RepID=A0A3S4UVG6_9FLAO|nr:aldehyde dehydrogenase family protein [Kaistella antarctica]KEY19832.1 aldehyde dehydrogenase [Kaistella antarctica]SEV97127.1 aldehyde dehydrogenase (NAD+) [Kaistella antarctica]VEH96370.1 Succinate-semialdehyde dehydrogenase [NADP(+)] [Kaistella antarctica]
MSQKIQDFGIEKSLANLGITKENKGVSSGGKYFASGDLLESYSPTDGKLIATVQTANASDYDQVIDTAKSAYLEFRQIPAPKRGELVRQFGLKLREYKDDLGKLVSYEMGKSLQEGLGEVQEMIDICDFAVGLSRQLHGYTMHSERPGHRMYEQYHPLGIVGIISAFNFPVAVWSWNTALAWICGNVTIWKPSEKAPLCGIACQNIIIEVLKENNLPEGISTMIVGDYTIGDRMVNDKNVALISFTGSTKVGRLVGTNVAKRFGKSILELGGNNAIIFTENADLNMSIIGAVFGAVGTAGQRCTSTRRLIIHESIFEEVKNRLVKAYGQIKIGNPLDENNHVGPLIDKQAVEQYLDSIEKCKKEGGKFVVEGGVLEGENFDSGCYVKPCIAEVENSYEIVQHETFAPILYIMKYKTLDEAIAMQNNVPQGLSSAIMTTDMRQAELFLSQLGSDCGIANVNIGTSGAEIGGAFGGEKETGGGRESGSDVWKYYMRRQTNTINYTDSLPLAQGIKFDL